MKYFVTGDPANKARFSSHIIIDSLNKAAKKIGLYDENGKNVTYCCVANSYSKKVDAFITTYEIDFCDQLLNNIGKTPVFGVSADNAQFMLNGGIPKEQVGWFSLGVDSSLYPKITKTKSLDTFNIGIYTESLVRGGTELCLEYLGRAYGGDKQIKVFFKDRNATSEFEQWVKKTAEYYDLNLEYLNCHFSAHQEIIDWFSNIDCHLYLNRSSTFAMPPIESVVMGIPTICCAYSGPKTYILNNRTGLNVEFDLTYVDEDLPKLLTIGARNFFFSSGYKTRPVWATAKESSVIECVEKIRTNQTLASFLSYTGRAYISRNLTWENSALNLSKLLTRFY